MRVIYGRGNCVIHYNRCDTKLQGANRCPYFNAPITNNYK